MGSLAIPLGSLHRPSSVRALPCRLLPGEDCLCLFCAAHASNHQAHRQHSTGHAEPAEAQLVEGQLMQSSLKSAQRDAGVRQCVQSADHCRAQNRHGIDKAVPLPQVMAEAQQDQDDRYRVNGIQDWHRNAQNHIQAQIADQK